MHVQVYIYSAVQQVMLSLIAKSYFSKFIILITLHTSEKILNRVYYANLCTDITAEKTQTPPPPIYIRIYLYS